MEELTICLFPVRQSFRLFGVVVVCDRDCRSIVEEVLMNSLFLIKKKLAVCLLLLLLFVCFFWVLFCRMCVLKAKGIAEFLEIRGGVGGCLYVMLIDLSVFISLV